MLLDGLEQATYESESPRLRSMDTCLRLKAEIAAMRLALTPGAP
jgi:hypothetical protein